MFAEVHDLGLPSIPRTSGGCWTPLVPLGNYHNGLSNTVEKPLILVTGLLHPIIAGGPKSLSPTRAVLNAKITPKFFSVFHLGTITVMFMD